ncbi:PKD domain-containing protein [Hymenobacter terricola]|uniref:PKD domain-containing protein n=1 Tax=Hymenobacter terricola TaxID=2819236 RepID=UPI001B30F748|nr:PKD domain-containing protein [Hymenobacter terricola]
MATAKTKTKATIRANSRLDSELKLLDAQAGSATASELRVSFPQLSFGLHAGQPTVLVRITAKDVNALLPVLQSRGFEVSTSYPKLHFVEGMLPVSQLAAADALSSYGLMGILASLKPESNGGLVTSQADYLLEADRARATRPKQATGVGVTIGVVSDSFNALGGAGTDVASGDLPATGVRVLHEGNSTDTDEGRGMCQLIYDLAPGSPQVFSTSHGGEGVFAQYIRDLANPAIGNCKVIVDDIFYFAEPMFQDGVIAQAITDVVTNRGVAYFSSAGNHADNSYENAAPQFVANANGVRCLNFDVSGTTIDLTQRLTIGNGVRFRPYLQWSDPFYTTNGVRTDLDMYLLAVSSTGVVDTVARSSSRNLLTQTPLEFMSFTNATATTGTTTFDLVVVLKGGAMPTRVKYINANNGSAVPIAEWNTSSSTTFGHNTVAEAMSVAAVPYYNQRVKEGFTSKGGPLPFLFSPTGAALSTPAIRQKPNIASIDGTNTTFFGYDYEGDGFANFFGTSAAAPHAAAVAALLRSAEPTLTPAQVYSRLLGSARLLPGTSAADPYTGAGLVDAFTALYGPVVAATPPLVEDLEKGALPVSWRVEGTGAARTQVSTLAPASGIQGLLLDAYPNITSVFSLNEATLFLQGAAATNLRLTFRERKYRAETDEPMPAQFAGHSNTDGVALSVDGGTTWYRVVDLTGINATTVFQTTSVDLTAFATANSLTLGNDIRIKFQQYGRGGATAANFSNRAGRVFDDIVVGSRIPAPAPLYIYSQPTTGCPGLQVQYADSSLFRPTAWAWTFAGGTPASSTLPNPNVTYNTPGHHSVTLSVTNAAGTVARTDTGVVVIYGRAPVATITSTNLSVCRGGAVTFGSSALYCPGTFLWSFPGGLPATSAAQNPSAVTYATAGSYTATLTVSNAFGSATTSIVVLVGAPLPSSFTETFNAATTLPGGWSFVTPAPALPWALVDGIFGRLGSASRALRAPFADDPTVGSHPAVYTPTFDLTTNASATLKFDVAYRPYASVAGGPVTANDSLIVQIASACTGAILGRPYAKGALGTLPTGASKPGFVPTTAAEWRQETVDLTPYAGNRVVIRFVGSNGHGNYLYLDNVQLSSTPLSMTSAANAVGFEAWPNPTPGGTALNLRLPAFTGQVSLRLVDALGRVVWQEQVQQTGGALEHTLRPVLASGLYDLLYVPAGSTPVARHLVLE